MLKNINLQLFSGDGEDVEFEIENDDVPEIEIETDDDTDLDDIEIENDDAVKGTEKNDTQSIEKEQMVPLKALEAERKKWKQKIEKLSKGQPQTTTNNVEFDEQAFLNSAINKYVKMGWDEDTARFLAEEKLEDKRAIHEIRSSLNDTGRSATKIKRDIEVESLAKDPFYSDIEDVRDEVEKLADKSGLSLKQAYNALYGENKYNFSRTDLERQVEQRVLNNMQKKQSAYVDTTANGETEVKPKVKLSNDELAIAKAAGMTAQEYYSMKNLSNTEQYKKYKTKRKG